MKKVLSFILVIITLFSLVSCNSDNKKTDEIALPFIKAMLLRDNDEMSNYLHPDYKESALPNDDFYTDLSKNHFLTVGNQLDGLNAIDKKYINDTSFQGQLMECDYLIRTNELLYDVKLMILENDKGYGIVAVSMKLNTTVNYFSNEPLN